jgi:hypothetical protein
VGYWMWLCGMSLWSRQLRPIKIKISQCVKINFLKLSRCRFSIMISVVILQWRFFLIKIFWSRIFDQDFLIKIFQSGINLAQLNHFMCFLFCTGKWVPAYWSSLHSIACRIWHILGRWVWQVSILVQISRWVT